MIPFKLSYYTIEYLNHLFFTPTRTLIDHNHIPIPQPPEKRAEEEEFDVSLVDAMSTTMVKYCSASSGVHFVHERVVEILSEGVTLTNSGREKFALGCYKSIFRAKAGL